MWHFKLCSHWQPVLQAPCRFLTLLKWTSAQSHLCIKHREDVLDCFCRFGSDTENKSREQIRLIILKILHFCYIFWLFFFSLGQRYLAWLLTSSLPVCLSLFQRSEFPVPENFTIDKRDTSTAAEEWRSVGPLLVPFPQHCCEACLYECGGDESSGKQEKDLFMRQALYKYFSWDLLYFWCNCN